MAIGCGRCSFSSFGYAVGVVPMRCFPDAEEGSSRFERAVVRDGKKKTESAPAVVKKNPEIKFSGGWRTFVSVF